MCEPRIRIFPNLDALSHAAAELFAAQALERAGKGNLFSVAFSGGKTPQAFLRLLSSSEFSERLPWEGTHLFQVDERSVPPDDPQSNYRMIRESLLDAVPAAATRFHRMRAEQPDRDAASGEYARELESVLDLDEDNVPCFDLIFLGMGPDGHTASLFPGSKAVAERRKWVCPNYVEKLRMYRLTLTYPVLNAASEIVFMVAGADKAEALHQVIEGPRNLAIYPAQGIVPVRGKVTWLIDEAAAGRLSVAHRSAS